MCRKLVRGEHGLDLVATKGAASRSQPQVLPIGGVHVHPTVGPGEKIGLVKFGEGVGKGEGRPRRHDLAILRIGKQPADTAMVHEKPLHGPLGRRSLPPGQDEVLATLNLDTSDDKPVAPDPIELRHLRPHEGIASDMDDDAGEGRGGRQCDGAPGDPRQVVAQIRCRIPVVREVAGGHNRQRPIGRHQGHLAGRDPAHGEKQAETHQEHRPAFRLFTVNHGVPSYRVRWVGRRSPSYLCCATYKSRSRRIIR